MKCERCGHQLENDDLFCPKCGKAVFEEYMDDDDIWEHYKPDEELFGDNEPEAAAARAETPEEPEVSETVRPEEDTAEDTPAEDKGPDILVIPDAVSEPEKDREPAEKKRMKEQRRAAAARTSANDKPDIEPKKKDPIWLICGCILLVCLIVGVMLGIGTLKKEDQAKKEYYARLEAGEDKDKAAKGDEPQSQDGSAEGKETESGEGQETQNQEEQKTDNQDAAEEKQEEEPKKQEYFQMVDAGGIDFSQLQKIAVTSAEQNSMSSSDNYDYSANSAVDGDETSSWQEGEEGLGEGTGIKLNFDGNHKVRYILLHLGNWRSEDMWNANARPAVMSISVGDSQKKDVEFSNEMKAFCLSFDEPVEASYVSLYIQSGYGGDRWNDNCISEVEIYE